VITPKSPCDRPVTVIAQQGNDTMPRLIPSDALDEETTYLDPGQRRPRRLNDRQLHKPKVDRRMVRASVQGDGRRGVSADLVLADGLDASSEERAYLTEQLGPFFRQKKIVSVLRRVKGGKEANVYCCTAHPDTGLDLIAAKVYRSREFRNLKNDSLYRQGRAVLNTRGEVIDLAHDWRLAKAIQGKSRKGLEVTQGSWVAHEYQTIARLQKAGVSVPIPIANSNHAFLMEYWGEIGLPAPTLHLVRLDDDEAPALFEQSVADIGVMLRQGVIHGDLSAYNILYWEGRTAIIDFPQVVDPDTNPDARVIFGRDVERICDYFKRYGVRADPRRIAGDLWADRQAPPPLPVETLDEEQG